MSGKSSTLIAVIAANVGFWLTPAQAQELVIPGSAAMLSVENDALCSISTSSELSCFTNRRAPQLAVPAGIGLVSDVSVGKGFACAIELDGDVECWGDPSFGRLEVPDNASPAVSIDAGEAHACVINEDGEAVCWGLSSNDRTIPPNNGASYVDIAAGEKHSCAVRDDGIVDCWGAEDAGTSVRPDNFPLATKVSVNNDSSCVLSVDGDIVCWFRDRVAGVRSPDVPSNGPYTDVTLAGGGDSDAMICGLEVDGNADCLVSPGRNLTVTDALTLETEALELGPFTQIDSAALFSTTFGQNLPFFAGCGVRADGSIACWESPDQINVSTPDSQDPELVVLNLRAEVYSRTVLELFWDVPAGADNFGSIIMYEIFRDGELIATTANRGSYLDESLSGSTEVHTYQIHATTTTGVTGELSSSVIVDTVNAGAPIAAESFGDPSFLNYTLPDRPGAPQNLEAFVYGPTTGELIWQNPRNRNVGYEVYMNSEFVGFTTGSSFFFNNLPANSAINFQVFTVLADGRIEGVASVSVGLGRAAVCF